jgi:hypothetical protein
MRLRDLDAQFVGHQHDNTYWPQGDVIDGAQGVLFQCPKCAIGCEAGEEDGRRFVRGAHYVLIWFANPQNAPVAGTEADSEPHHRWTFGGSSIDDLTLSPSVNLDIPSLIEVDHCRWHGWVKNGDAA